MRFSIATILMLVPLALFGYVLYLLIRALCKYIRSGTVRAEKTQKAKTLGGGTEAAQDTVQNDVRICGGDAGRQPSGGFKVGKRDI